MTILHINHASLLIEHKDSGTYFLTDPWYISPAFGGWTQHPSPYADSIRKILEIPANKLNVIISHGHDDHLDEFFIKSHLRNANFFVPKFQTNGLSKRIEKLTGKYPTELSEEDCVTGDVRLNAFVNEEFTNYDSVITIKINGKIIIHANDNWHLYPDSLIQKLRKCVSNMPANEVYYLVQFGIADCFPLNYPGFDATAIADLITKRFKSYQTATNANFEKLGIKPERGFYYANQSKYVYPKPGPTLYDLAQDFLAKTGSPFIQCIPGSELGMEKQDRSSDPTLFQHCLKQLEKFISQKLKSDLPLKLITFSDKIDTSAVCYQAEEHIWQRIFIGEITLEAIVIGGMGLIHKPMNANISNIHHQVSKLSYLIQSRVLEFGLNFYYGK